MLPAKIDRIKKSILPSQCHFESKIYLKTIF